LWAEEKGKSKKIKISLYKRTEGAILNMAFLGGLGKAPTFLVPIINPPFADNSPHFPPGGLLHQIRNITGGVRAFSGARARFRAGLFFRRA
jgi:hypothetical protein